MLVLTRAKGDSVLIGDDVTVTVLSVGRSRCTCGARQDGVRVQVGIDAPRGVRIMRGEIYDSVRAANLASADGEDAAAAGRALAGRLLPAAPTDPEP